MTSRKISVIAALIFSCLISAGAQAQFFLIGEFGRGEIDFDQDYLFADFDGDDGAASIAFITGYRLPSNFVFSGSVGFTNSEASFSIGDEFQLYELGAHLAYSVDVAEHFRIVPAIGMSFWELGSL